jgi:polar amino acid transport system substrate-binding protein
MKQRARWFYPLTALVVLLMACQPAPPSPTAAPAKPTEAAKPAASPAASPATSPAAVASPPPSPAAAASPSPAASPAAVSLPPPGNMPAGSFMRQIQDRGRLLAGVRTDAVVSGFLNPRTNKIEGFDVDIVKEVARAIFNDPEKVELKEVTSTTRIPSVKDGTVDVVASTMTITKARMEEIDFSDVYYESGQQVLVPKNSPIRSIQDTAGKRVCALKSSTSGQNITKFQPQASVVEADRYPDCLLAVQQGRADAISTDDVILVGLAEQDPNMEIVGERFTQEPFGIGIAKGHPEFVQFVNGVLAQVKQRSRWKEIHQQWLGKNIPTPEPPTRTAQQAAQ